MKNDQSRFSEIASISISKPADALVLNVNTGFTDRQNGWRRVNVDPSIIGKTVNMTYKYEMSQLQVKSDGSNYGWVDYGFANNGTTVSFTIRDDVSCIYFAYKRGAAGSSVNNLTVNN